MAKTETITVKGIEILLTKAFIYGEFALNKSQAGLNNYTIILKESQERNKLACSQAS
jgi:hypothetical protein